MSISVPTPENFKEKAKIIRTFMKEKYGVDVSQGHGLELMSQLFGLKDWNTASAVLKTKGRLPTYIKTVGQMKKVLSKFDDSLPMEMWGLNSVEGYLETIKELNLKNEMFQNRYSLISDGVSTDIASFQLKLEDQKLFTSDLRKEIDPFKNLHAGICDL